MVTIKITPLRRKWVSRLSILFAQIFFLLLAAFWQTPSGLSCAFYRGMVSIWPPFHKGLIEMDVLLESFLISTEELWSSVRLTIRFLVTSLTKALLPRLLSLAGQPALGRVLVVPNCFHLRIMEATVSLGIFNGAEICWCPSPDLWLDTILSRISTDNSLNLMALFLLWHALSTVGS